MAFIDIGNPAIVRPGNIGCANTKIDINNPANASGTIVSVEIYVQETLYNVEIAIFEEVSANHFTVRSHSGNLGSKSVGKKVFEVSLEVQQGDYIGIWYTSGKIKAGDVEGSTKYWSKVGDNIPCTNAYFNLQGYRQISLWGRSAYVLPTVTTQNVSSIGSTTAYGNGNITNIGSGNVTVRGVCWNKTGNPTYSDSKSYQTGSFGTGAFSRFMSGLDPNTLYYVKAFAYNDAGLSYGSQVNFTTNKAKPTVTTQACTGVTGTSATGNGNITNTGGDNATIRGFCYKVGTTGDPTTADDKVYDTGSFGTGAFNKTIPNLTPGESYRVRAYAINPQGTGYGTTVQLVATTPIDLTTQAVTEIGSITAKGNGTITDLHGENATKRGFCWSTSEAPTVADSTVEESGSFGTGAFNLIMTGLSPGVLYYVRAYAYNSAGYAYGTQVDFTTDKVAPTVTTQSPTDILPTTVTANGNITALGGENATVRGFKYGLTKTDTWDAHDDGSYGVGEYTKGLTGLVANTIYWIRAYATNSIGTSYGAWVEFQTAASGTIPTGTDLFICADLSGYSYQLMKAETDDGEEYTAYFVISTDLTNKQGLAFYKRILDLHLYFMSESEGTATIYVKRDNEAEWQTVGTVSLTGSADIIVPHLAPDLRAKVFLFKISAKNFFRFLGVLIEYLGEDLR